MDASYPKEDEIKAREWMESIVGEPIGDDFFEGLKDGSYLCRWASEMADCTSGSFSMVVQIIYNVYLPRFEYSVSIVVIIEME